MAKAPTAEVTVFSPEGVPQKMSRANARDLVLHAGWSFKPNGAVVNPTDTLFRPLVNAPAGDKAKAQEILDSQGGSLKAIGPVASESDEEESIGDDEEFADENEDDEYNEE